MFNFDETTVGSLKYLENYKTDRYLFRILNNPKIRPAGHSANKIVRYDNGDPYAVHCNCGWYHPVFAKNNRHEIEWSITIKVKKSSLVEGELKEIWKREL